MGVVYEAVDAITGQRVALKELGPRDATAAEKLRADFKALSSLSHPNVARALDLVEAGGIFLAATELVDGGDSLGAVRGPALRGALVQMARGLVALHSAGLTHGNLKPSNVRMSARGGRLVLLDAGALGSPMPAYAAPEQLGQPGQAPTRASDWYSLGAMLHEALTGRLPFIGTPSRVVEQKRAGSAPPPIRASSPGTGPELEGLCMELLQTDPARRPPGEEVLRRLEALVRAPALDQTRDPGERELPLEERPTRPPVPVPAAIPLPAPARAPFEPGKPPSAPTPATPEDSLLPPVREFRGTQRFQVLKQVGSGGMGMVYAVHDRERDQEVALKTLRQISPHGLYLFKNEFRALADLRHENLVTFHELFCDEGLWFFTMELLQGEDLLAHVRAGWPPPRFDEARLRAALPQLVRGLMALHAAGKIHRDVKPSNVMVTTTGRVVLMDFGLAVDQVDASEESLIGTPHYMAPEQITGQNVGPPADYYALGVVLHQLLTGRFPFEGGYAELLELKRTREPLPPARLSTRVPEDLSRLTADLLRMEPDARPTGPHLLQRLGAPPAEPEETPAPPSPAELSEVRFVGREPELEALHRTFQEVRGGAARGVLVHGESGVGKSALVRHFVEDLRDEGRAMVLSGRCYEQESVPYKAFDGVVDALSRELLHLDEVTARSVLPDDAALVARLFPVLQRVPAVQSMRLSRPLPADPFELRSESFTALRTMLRHLGRLRPVVLFVDDLQWADQDSLALLGELFSPPSPPPFLLVATLRGNAEDIRSADGVLAPLAWVTDSLQELQLLPMPEKDALALARELEPDAARAGELVLESGGHPLFLIELGHRPAQAPAPEPARARAEAAPKLGLDELLQRRAKALPSGAQHLLGLVALAGSPIPQALLSRASGLSTWELANHVQQLRRADMVRTMGLSEKASIEPYHDRVRESVLHWLAEPTRRQYHHELALALESTGAETFAALRMLVTHLELSGAPQRAGLHAARAAEMAAQALAFGEAADLYRAAIRLFPGRDPAEQQRLRVELSRALDYAARGAEAARAYLEAADGAEGAERREYRRKAAELLLASGHVDEGLEAIDGVLREVGAALPSSRRAAMASLAWQRFQLQVRGLGYQKRAAPELPRETLDRIDTFFAIQTGLSGVDSVRAFAFQTRGFRLALDAGEERRIGRGMAVEGFNVATAGGAASRKASLDLIARARTIAEALGDPYLRALSTVTRGMALYLTGDFAEGARLIAEGEQIQRELVTRADASVAKEFGTARLLRLQALRLHGDLKEMERSTLEYVKDAVARGDLFAEVSFLRAAAFRHLAADAPEKALEDLDAKVWPGPRGAFHNQHWYSLRMRAEVALYGAEPTARAFLAEEFQAFRRSALPNLQVARVEAEWLWARLSLLEAFVPHSRADALREVRKAIRTLESEKVAYAAGLALLLRACLDSMGGDKASAERYLAQARDALRGSMELCAEVAAYRLGQMAGTPWQLAEAEGRLKELGVRQPARIADVVAPGPFG